ncbi:MAG TPA: S8 family serine peptidase [Patescibacteria group bacterium]|nr:S8 family serine peptidase [Patescibacteria group bacterium]
MNRRLLAALGSTALLLGTILPGATLAATPQVHNGPQRFSEGGIYLVQLRELPTVAYDGKTAGLAATKPARGHKLDMASAAVTRYVGHLTAKHEAELKTHGGTKLYDYAISYNGFAAKLSAAQANALAADKDVQSIVKNEIRTVDTSSTPAFLGLTVQGGLWDQLGGVGKAGENIIIGDIDSGIWPESRSFADRVDAGGNPTNAPGAKRAYQNLPGASIKCAAGEAWTSTNCNQKLIGARYFNAAFGGDAGINATRPWEYNSARDYNGHGTHTASTAGGNFGVSATGSAASFGKVSGMAPRARIVAYKALWSTQDASTASGNTADLVAAIDQAVADGVDVINYSISGTSTNFVDPVEISYLFAADAGIFVSESAGNSGPSAATVAHPGPWTTTVAAGTHNRNGEGSVTLGNGVTYTGASVATGVGPAPLIDSAAAGVAGADPAALALCFTAGNNGGTAVLDPAKVAGKIVVCDRGVNARVDKSLAVKDAGGVGMILVNTSPNSMNADFHFVPTVHLQSTDRAAVKAYAATAGATATINASTIVLNAPAPFTASFSSRGPLLAGGGDLLKPDIIAPGQDILAAVAPPGNHGLDFSLLSGTSMSAPHITGIAALLKDLHPTWSPMAIKSALMTSAGDVLDGPNTSPLVIFRQGAGHVAPNSAADPGLVYDSGFLDWLAFLCGTTSAVRPETCASLAGGGYSTDPSNFNGASIAIGNLAGVQTITRTVTNVGGGAATYTPTVTGLAGVTVDIAPTTLNVPAGGTASYTVRFTRTTAALNAYVGGQLTWTDGTHRVRSPIVVKPVALAAPAAVSGNGTAIQYDVTFGYAGPFTATARGLVAATKTPGSVMTDSNPTFAPASDVSTVKIDVVVPAGTTFARFSLFDDDVSPASDLDLYVYNGSTAVGGSGSGTSAEQVDLVNPVAGTYSVYIHGFATGNPSTFNLYHWLVGSVDAGNMSVSAPASATTGVTAPIGLTFNSLNPATRYVGTVAYAGVAGMPNPTIVSVHTP